MHFPLTQNGATPLFIASNNGRSDVVNILIRNGADVNLTFQVLCTKLCRIYIHSEFDNCHQEKQCFSARMRRRVTVLVLCAKLPYISCRLTHFILYIRVPYVYACIL